VRVRKVSFADDLHLAAFEERGEFCQFPGPAITLGTDRETVETVRAEVLIDNHAQGVAA
jgi:hypothetical protein